LIAWDIERLRECAVGAACTPLPAAFLRDLTGGGIRRYTYGQLLLHWQLDCYMADLLDQHHLSDIVKTLYLHPLGKELL